MAMHKAESKYIKTSSSALAVSRSCILCKFYVVRRLGKGGGRGNGFREGNKQRGIMIQHLKAEHPTEYAAAMCLTHPHAGE